MKGKDDSGKRNSEVLDVESQCKETLKETCGGKFSCGRMSKRTKKWKVGGNGKKDEKKGLID